MSDHRRKQILKAIVEIFVQTASPVGSKFLKEEAVFDLSPATLRTEMARLEKEGLLSQPHTSGGRIPTSHGYRFFVNELSVSDDFRATIHQKCVHAKEEYFNAKKADESVFDIVSILTQLTPNIAFATMPSAKKTFFLGISQLLQNPEFLIAPQNASGIFRVLEENFFDFLSSLHLSDEIEVFIGNENMIPEMESCSIVVSKFEVLGQHGFFGILGPMRMDYANNIVAMEEAQKLFNY